MKNKLIASMIAAFFLGTLLVPLAVDAKYATSEMLKQRARSLEIEKAPSPDSVTLCPVSGMKAEESEFLTYQGEKIFFCCGSCEKPFLKNPDKYLN